MDVAFTAGMENRLDEIEEGTADWVKVLRDFYGPFASDIEKAQEKMENLRKEPKKADRKCPTCGKDMVYRWRGASKYIACVDYPECKTTIALNRDGTEKLKELTEHKCPKCQSQMILRSGRFGKFLACSAYPECRFSQNLGGEGRGKPEDQPTDELCDRCGRPMVIKHGRYGQFVACSGYPECKNTKPVSLGITCPETGCGGQIVQRRSKRGRAFYSCSNYPGCKFVVWQRPLREPCPKCGAPFLTERRVRGKLLRECVRERCDYREEAETTVA
jgi:DNA topoisomerase-1